jgi:pimeloyl-ACP methyl ester carboxylesterase
MGPAEAPLIVLVHGAMDRSAAMVLLSRRLDEDFRVLRYDRRGYARSHGAGGPFTMDSHVADLESLLAGRRALVVAVVAWGQRPWRSGDERGTAGRCRAVHAAGDR